MLKKHCKNAVEMSPNIAKMPQDGTKLALSCHKLGKVGEMLELCWPMLAHLGAMLGYVGQLGPFSPPPGGILERTWAQVGPKLAQVGGKFGQVGAKMRHVGAKLAQVGAKVAQVGAKMEPK